MQYPPGILAHAFDVVICFDDRQHVVAWNGQAERFFGLPAKEAIGRALDDLTSEPKLAPLAPLLRSAFEGKPVQHAEISLRNAEQSAAVLEINATRLREPAVVAVIARDITATRRAEEALRKSEERFQFLNELGEATREISDPRLIMATVARLLGRHLHVSRCAYADVEADSDRFTIQQDYTDGCASTVGDYHLALFGPRAVTDLLAGRTLVIRDVDAELSPSTGAEMFNAIGIKAIVTCPLVKEGRLRAMMAVHQAVPRDWLAWEIALVEEVVERCWAIIERARADAEAELAAQAIAESTERFRLLAQVVSLQVWTAQLTGELDYANQECADYFGLDSPEGALGNGWTEFVHPDDLPNARALWQRSLATGERYEAEFRLRRHDGEYRWFIARAQAMRDSDGAIARWFGTNTDIHDLKTAQSDAERASRAKDAFLAALSHELRTPLTPVLMTAAALRADERLPADAREQLAMMERNIALEARLIDDLLDLTRIARGQLHLRSELCDAHSLIALAVEIVRDDAQAKGIALERKLGAKRSGLVADPARFQQVIWNLLRNSVKFTPRGGRVAIRTTDEPDGETGGLLRIEVTDSGIGIDPAALERIFLPFEQGEAGDDHRFGGMGLGLAIARAIVDLHGGTIAAQSAGPDRGATFTVELPGATEAPHGLTHPPDLHAELATAAGVPVTLHGDDVNRESLRLLVVEDHESTRQVLSRLLTRAGHQVVTADTLSAALAAAAEGSFDLVISDLGLPDGSGNELMEILRARYTLRGIALSGYGMEDDVVRSRHAGFTAHLTKPVDFRQLQRALDEAMAAESLR